MKTSLTTAQDAVMAAASGNELVNAVIWLVGIGLIVFVLFWFIGYIGLPEPFAKVAKVLVGLVAVVALIKVIMQITGASF